MLENSIERLSLTEVSSGTSKQSWELIEVAADLISPRSAPAVVSLNNTEFVIMGGWEANSNHLSSAVVIFNTKTRKC